MPRKVALNTKKNKIDCMRPIIISTYPPRKCGIAEFTHDLFDGMKQINIKSSIIAMIKDCEEDNYPEEVVLKIREDEENDYIKAAEWINESGFDIVNIQHEFGIFGGEWGSYIIKFAERLKVPLITTLHTVVSKPQQQQLEVTRELSLSSRIIVVLTDTAIDLLYSSYGIKKDKIRVINHGVPKPSIYSRSYLKRVYGFKGKRVISTFGLIHAGKGIEYAISGFARIASKYPDTIYLIIGETHPNVKRLKGESYREKLTKLSEELGISERIIMINRFLEQDELMNFLRMTDIFITPYIGYEQISSGALTFAIGSGKAIISTPYIYAVDMLRSNNGILCKFMDENSIADALDYLLYSPDRQKELEQRTKLIGDALQWNNIAREYIKLFEEIVEDEVQKSIKI